MSDLRIVIIDVILVLGVFLLSRWARRNPNERLAVALFRLTFGPRTDVKYMSRSELFRSAASFLIWTLVFGIIMQAVVFAGFSKSREPAVLTVVLLFASSLALGMSGLAAIYMFLRGLLRSSAYRPPRE